MNLNLIISNNCYIVIGPRELHIIGHIGPASKVTFNDILLHSYDFFPHSAFFSLRFCRR